MKAVILAAGRGSRLGTYTEERPKCLLEVAGMTLLERQIALFRRFGIEDIVVVRGYAAEKIDFGGVRYYSNEIYADTNMVYSLFCAECELQGDVIVSYADILFQDSTLTSLLEAPYQGVLVAVDILWEEYYRERFQRPFEEAESLVYDTNGRIWNIGKSRPDRSEVQAQYIGLIRLSSNGSRTFRSLYQRAKAHFWDKPWVRNRVFQKAYMTDFLQALIDEGVSIYAVPIEHGWLEFDCVTDYIRVREWYASGTLGKYCLIDSP